ncbi:antirestriction protein ArdA [Nocardia farcinica]|uniref:antirestriction protein ArdA n=1 Tax=Nocardia farcinica TaxID=37329 RepID=UPI001895C390|nr:antirestriction protein ArdA [Nocardia farcinica]MBF6271294.1 antirestriction protein ArdA [Nocardia farcinica]MBF6422835.1 antirestriction protein ArdA [Nocardia farcinica]MBF6434565.1 antirestriction protein ArdA [Nocardia farcinica]MBF6505654.1 antirestriction protein ArdA [Nocardia farcinica]
MSTDCTPTVWLGCLTCYNSGHLVGHWYPATDAATVTPSQLHGRSIPEHVHEELWVFDHEHLPTDGELDPVTASKWGELYDQLDDPSLWPALCAWVRSGDHVEDGDGMPSLGDFEERFCGTWDSFLDYAIDLAEETGVFAQVPEDLRRFIDMAAWAAEIEADYVTENAPGGGVYIFRNF